MHLSNENLKRLLAGTAEAAEARALAAHLEEECPRCEALLASTPTPLDGVADRALTALAPARPEEAGHDLEYARIQRALRERPSASSRWARLAVAAAVLIVGGAGLQLALQHGRQDAWDGVKGVTTGRPQVVPVRLSVVAVEPAEGQAEPRIWKVAGGDSVPHDAALQLRLQAGGAADVAVVRLGAGSEVETFWHHRVAAGPVQITVDGRPAAYPLAGLAGPQRFVALSSAGELAPERVAAAARALATPARMGEAERGLLEGISIDVLEITVR
jgi:hypothetical protein